MNVNIICTLEVICLQIYSLYIILYTTYYVQNIMINIGTRVL